jgi:hypothetical protein
MDPNDWNTDYVPAPVSPADEFVTVDTQYGPMEKWKARALAIGWFQRAVQEVRDDSVDVTPLKEEDKPPPLAADEEEPSGSLTDDELQAIEEACDQLSRRLDALEARRRAERALLDAEAEVEKQLEKLGHSSDDTEATGH